MDDKQYGPGRMATGKLFFPVRHQSTSLESVGCGGKRSLLNMLRQREVTGSCRLLSRLSFAQPLYGMKVASRRWDAVSSRWRSHSTTIDTRSIYLGLSHDTTLLVQLTIDVADPLIAPFDVEGDNTSSSLRLLIYRTTPTRLDLTYEMDLGKRSPFTTLHVGFSCNNSLMCSFSFDPNDHYSAPSEQDYEGRVLFDILLPARSLHVSLQSIVVLGRKKTQILKGGFLRIMDHGFLYDVGTDIVAIGFSTEYPSRITNRTVFSARKETSGDSIVAAITNGTYAKDIRVCTCTPTSSTASAEKLTLEIISEANEAARPNDSALLYITENNLNAEKLLQTVARSAVKRSLPDDCKFMGVNAAHVHVVELCFPTVTVLVFGIVEFQSPAKYMFALINALVEWDLRQPAKASLLKWTAKDTDWRRAISKSREWFPERPLPSVLKLEDRLLTNDVVESLKCLHGSYPGGMVLTL